MFTRRLRCDACNVVFDDEESESEPDIDDAMDFVAWFHPCPYCNSSQETHKTYFNLTKLTLALDVEGPSVPSRKSRGWFFFCCRRKAKQS